MAASSSFSSMPEMSESNNMLLMALMEEIQEDHEYYIADDRLISMIQCLEVEISSTRSADDDPCQNYDMETGQVDDQDCSTSSSSSISYSSSDWDDMEVISDSSSLSSTFDKEMMNNAWSLCAAGGDVSTYDYCDSSEFYYGVLLENYLQPQEASDLVFNSEMLRL